MGASSHPLSGKIYWQTQSYYYILHVWQCAAGEEEEWRKSFGWKGQSSKQKAESRIGGNNLRIVREKKAWNYFASSWWHELHWSPSWHVSLYRWTRGTYTLFRRPLFQIGPSNLCCQTWKLSPLAPRLWPAMTKMKVNLGYANTSVMTIKVLKTMLLLAFETLVYFRFDLGHRW